MKKAKMIFGTLLTVLLIGALAYFTGFLANLFKAFDNTPFHPPPMDFVSTFFALSEWRYVRSALITLGIIFLIIAFIVIKNRIESRNFDDRNFSVSEKGTYGTAKYLSENQAKKLVTADKANKLLSICSEIGENDKGIILGKFPNGKTFFKQVIPKENMNMFVCSAPGSGKSYMFVRPYLAQCIKRKESFVCTDPSGELLESMGGYAKSCGYKVKVFNLVDPEKSDSWNVTGEVGIDQMLAQIAVSTIIQNTIEGETPDPFWDNGEKNLLKSLLLYINSSAYTGNKSLGELYQLLAADNFSDTLECLKSLDDLHPAKSSYNIYSRSTENVQASFASGLATRFQIFQSEAIRNMTAFDDIDLTAPGKEKCAYFIVMSDQDSTYQLLSSLFFSFLFIKLAEFGKTCPNQSLPVHVSIVLDELPSIGTIPDLGRKLATVRKYGVNVIPIVQLISQLDNRYSPAERDEIIGCCDTQIWLGSNDIASAEVLSERSGTMTVDVSSKSENLDFDTQAKVTSSVGRRPVLTVDEVLRLPLDEEIVVLRGQNVMKLKKYKFSEHPDFEKVKNATPITISNYKPEISDRYEHKEVKQNKEDDIPRSSLSDDTQPKEKKSRSKSQGLKIQGDV